MNVSTLIKALDELGMFETEVFISDSENGDLPLDIVNIQKSITPSGIKYIVLKSKR